MPYLHTRLVSSCLLFFWNKINPNLLCPASTVSLVSNPVSKQLSVASSDNAIFSALNDFSSAVVHFHFSPWCVNSRNGVVSSAWLGINWEECCAIPSSDLTSDTVSGGCISRNACTFFGDGHMPGLEKMSLKNSISGNRKWVEC